MDNPTTFADVAMIAVMGVIAIIIVGIIFFTRSRSGLERVRRAELERDDALQRADRLQTRVEQLEERLDRRVGRQLDQDDFDQQLER